MALFSRRSSGSIERRLRAAGEELRRARADLAVVEEQLVAYRDDADDSHVRALTSEDGNHKREHAQATRQLERHQAARARLVAKIEELRQEQDRLLDALPSPSAAAQQPPNSKQEPTTP